MLLFSNGGGVEMNENLLRMALVINTSHDNFLKNLSNVVLYLIYNDGDQRQYDIDQIRKEIKEDLYMEFTYEEIEDAVNNCLDEQYIVFINGKYILDQKGRDKVKKNNFDIKVLIDRYLIAYNLNDYTHEQIFHTICSYLYNLLNSNIKGLMKLLDITNNSDLKILDEDDTYSDEQKKIINDFLDWNDLEKNQALFKLIAFSVDYCRLTTKKNKNSFSSLLNGKRFYLDSNIIYRLMGINNELRKKATEDFIEKCKDAGIVLLYTNITYTELLDSFDHHINKLKKVLQIVKASPGKIRKLYQNRNDNSFYELYYQWANKNNSYDKWTEFKIYLKDELRRVISGFSMRSIMNSAVYDKARFDILADNLEEYKNTRRGSNRVNVEFDIQNILHISKERNGHSKNAWEVNDYIISADQVLSKWAEVIYPGEAPYVVVPSIWYSLLLKLTGRTDDDYKAYVEFMKLRYTQALEYNVEEIIYAISNLTQNGNVQDRMIDILTDDVKRVCDDPTVCVQEVNDLVNNAYDEVLEQIRQEEYDGGYNLGTEEGYNKGIEHTKEVEFEKGKKVGELESKRNNIIEKNKKKAKIIRNVNYVIIGVVALFSLFIIYKICRWTWYSLPKDKVEQFSIIVAIVTFALGGSVVAVIKHFLCIDIKLLEKKLNEKSRDELSVINNELNDLIR